MDRRSRPPDNINRGTVLLGVDISRGTVVKRKNCRTDFQREKIFSNSLAGSVLYSKNLLFVLFFVVISIE